MQLEQKLELSQSSDAVYFFKEGMFVQVFMVSLYISINILSLNLKVTGRHVKQLNNQFILRAGLPSKVLEQRFTSLVKTDFGYILYGNWHIRDFYNWYDYQRINIEQKYFYAKRHRLKLELSLQQQNFLLNWQENSDFDLAAMHFIKELKYQLTDLLRVC